MPDSCCSPPPPDEVPREGLTRRQMLVGGVAAGGALALSALPAGATGTAGAEGEAGGPDGFFEEGYAPPEGEDGHAVRSYGTSLSESPDKGIMFPVLGSNVSWTDTYGAPRSHGVHQGQDLMAPKMTKLLACVSGTIVEFRHRAQVGLSGGNSLWLRGDDGWFYSYLHINNDTPGTDDASNRPEHAWAPKLRQYVGNEVAARGVRVQRGEFIAYCGDSGNAENSGSHLHFEIRKPASGSFSSENARLWQSPAVNPRVSLQRAAPAREGVTMPPETFTPWTTSRALIDRQYRDFLGRPADAGALAFWGNQLDAGERSPQWLIDYLLTSAECDDKTQSVARLYQAFFLRLPDQSGFTFWTGRRRGGQSIASVADAFARSPEFTQRYGTLDNPQFVDRIYRNVLGRPADAEGQAFWTAELNRGRSRGTVMTQFSNSPENRNRQRWRMHVIAAYGCMHGFMPDAEALTHWVTQSASAGHAQALVHTIRRTASYRTRTGNG